MHLRWLNWFHIFSHVYCCYSDDSFLFCLSAYIFLKKCECVCLFVCWCVLYIFFMKYLLLVVSLILFIYNIMYVCICRITNENSQMCSQLLVVSLYYINYLFTLCEIILNASFFKPFFSKFFFVCSCFSLHLLLLLLLLLFLFKSISLLPCL